MPAPRSNPPVVLCAVEVLESSQPGPTAHAVALAEAAYEVAQRLGARLELIAAYQIPVFVVMDAVAIPLPQQVVSTETLHQDAMRELVARLPEGVTGHIHEGPTRDVVLDRAKELDALMLVIGRPAAGPLRRAVLGSVFEPLIQDADRPVVVVPLPELATAVVREPADDDAQATTPSLPLDLEAGLA